MRNDLQTMRARAERTKYALRQCGGCATARRMVAEVAGRSHHTYLLIVLVPIFTIVL